MSKAGEHLLAAARQMVEVVKLDDDALTGTRWHDHRGEIRVMTVCEGWIMARRKGCAPFLVHKSEWFEQLGFPSPTPKAPS